MSLCSLCLTVPWLSLPPPGKDLIVARVADKDEMLVVHYNRSADGVPDSQAPQQPMGFPFHENLETLAFSAKLCLLCGVIQNGVQAWINHWEEAAKNNKGFIEFDIHRHPIPTKQKLWVTKCYGGAMGFYVWAEHPEKKSLYMLTAVAFSVDRESPLSDRFPARPLAPNSGSTQSLEIVANWVKECSNRHEQCFDARNPSIPTRVIDVGLSGDTVKLVDYTDQTGSYVCLSYCWGDYPPYTTTKATLDRRRSGCQLSEMPKTFVDAIAVTRHLGIRYIWIDSLCICQDDAEDWSRESARMCDVYSNAYLVIAANLSSDCSGGCFHNRQPRSQAIINLPGNLEKIHATLAFASDQQCSWDPAEFRHEPLSKRGWALQERLMARRVLHYNSRQMYFECNHGVVAEDGSHIETRYHGGMNLDQGTDPSPKSPTDEASLHVTSLDDWSSLVWTYGSRKLSRPTDKLPALSGLAKIFQSRIQAEYIAGLWSNAIMEGIAWQGLKGQAPSDEYTGPSWSWAGYDGIGAMNNSFDKGWKDVASIRGWHTEPRNKTNPHGEVKPGAWIRVHGPITELKLSSKDATEHEIRLQRANITPLPRFCTLYSEEEVGTRVKPDHAEANTSDSLQHWDLQVMILRGRETKDIGNMDDTEHADKDNRPLEFFYGLVIRKVKEEQNADKFQRFGWMFVDKLEGYKIMEGERNWRTILLV